MGRSNLASWFRKSRSSAEPVTHQVSRQCRGRDYSGSIHRTFDFLEDRCVPASIRVNTLFDTTTPSDGLVSLREAINAINSGVTTDLGDSAAGGGTHSVVFGGLSGTISLLNQGGSAYGRALLEISSGKNVTIAGGTSGTGITISRGAGTPMRLFNVLPSATLTLDTVTITNGLAKGGNGGSGAAGGGGGAAGLGGAIFNAGVLNVNNCTFTGNVAQGGNGGNGSASNGGGGGGGGGLSGNGSQPTSGISGGGGGGTDTDGGSIIGGSNGGGNGGQTASGGAGGFGGGGGGGGYVLIFPSTGYKGGAGGFGAGGGGGGGSSNGDTGGNGGFGGGAGGGPAGAGSPGIWGGGGSLSYGGGGAGLGGAIFNNGGNVSITNSTFTANSSAGGLNGIGGASGLSRGGAVFNRSGSLSVVNSTLYNNDAEVGTQVYGAADADHSGGDFITSNGTSTTITNSILYHATNANESIYNTSIGGNPVTSSGAGNLFRSQSGFSGAVVSTANPLLSPLASLGGKTQQMAPQTGSPALLTGSTTVLGTLSGDQRGAPFSRATLVNLNPKVDIGAYQTQAITSFVVDSLSDADDNLAGAGQFSLREALRATKNPGVETITFAPSLTQTGPATIVLGGSRLHVTDPVTISGPGADRLTIDGNNLSQIFYIDGRTNGSIDVTIQGLTMTKGKALGGGTTIDSYDSGLFGGALLNDGANVVLRNFAVTNSSTTQNGGGIYNWQGASAMAIENGTIANNSAGNSGGGVFNWNTRMSIANSTISNNAAGSGGGIYNQGGKLSVFGSLWLANSATSYGGALNSDATAVVVNSTFVGNASRVGGGGIDNTGTLNVIHSTFAANRADSDGNATGTGGGIRTANQAAATTTLTNTVLVGNFLGTGTVANDLGTVKNVEATSNNNLIGDPATAGGLVNSVFGNILGKAGTGGARVLLPASEVFVATTPRQNGGPTATLGLRSGSPAQNVAAISTYEISLFGVASQSSSLNGNTSGFGAQLALDGNANTFTHTDTSNVNPYWQDTLPTDFTVTQVVLSNRGNCCQDRFRDITIEVRNALDTVVYTSPVLNQGNILNGPATLTHNFPAGIAGRTVRVRRASINGPATDDNNVLSLSGVSIVGAAATDQRGGGFKRTEFAVPDMGAMEFRPPLGAEIAGRNSTTGAWQIAVPGAGGTVTNVPGPTWAAGVNWLDTASVDLNGDGWSDLVGRDSTTGVWQASLANGVGGFTNASFGVWSAINWDDVRFGDFNGDGKADVVGRWRETGQWWTGISNGISFKNTYWGQWSVGAGVTWADVNIGDLDGDGDSDFLGRWAESGNWYAGLSSSGGMTNTYWGQWSVGAGVTWVDIRMGDLDADGKADILGRWKETGQLWAGISTGTSNTNVYWGSLSAGVTWTDVRLADFDGDGRSDMLCRYKEAGQWYGVITDNTPYRSHNALLGSWSASATWVDVLAIDVDQDGKADLVARDQASGQWYVAKSNGTTFTTSSYINWSAATAWANATTTRTR